MQLEQYELEILKGIKGLESYEPELCKCIKEYIEVNRAIIQYKIQENNKLRENKERNEKVAAKLTEIAIRNDTPPDRVLIRYTYFIKKLSEEEKGFIDLGL